MNLAEIRKSKNVTQTEVAERMGTTQSAVSRLESTPIENIRVGTLTRYVEALGAFLVLHPVFPADLPNDAT